jgi:hypothetical protein
MRGVRARNGTPPPLWSAIGAAGSGLRGSGIHFISGYALHRPDAAWLPEELSSLATLGPSRGADVTWWIADRVASEGWFMVGDAAAVLDPTSSHGVLKALLSGITAAHLIHGVMATKLAPMEAAAVYQSWLKEWFTNDAAHLFAFYRNIGMRGFDAPLRFPLVDDVDRPRSRG